MNRSSQLSGLFALGLLLLVVLACSSSVTDSPIPVPEDKKDYIGYWRAQSGKVSMKLNIASDGSVEYERKETTTGPISTTDTKSIPDGKITKFDGNDFVVKVLLVSTTFKVERPPYRDGERWKMVVDGVEVSRKDADEPIIDVAEMRKDDGEGKISSNVTDTFSRSDRKIYCYISWDNPKAGTKFKFVHVAVDAGGAKNEPLDEIVLVTENDFQNEGNSSWSFRRPQPRGDYRFDIYVNDKLERSVPFKIN